MSLTYVKASFACGTNVYAVAHPVDEMDDRDVVFAERDLFIEFHIHLQLWYVSVIFLNLLAGPMRTRTFLGFSA